MSFMGWLAGFRGLAKRAASEPHTIMPMLLPATWTGAKTGFYARRLFGSSDRTAPDPWVTIVVDFTGGNELAPLQPRDLAAIRGRALTTEEAETFAVEQLRTRRATDPTFAMHLQDGFVLVQWEDFGASLLLDPEFRAMLHQKLGARELVVAIPTAATLYVTTIDKFPLIQALAAKVITIAGEQRTLTDRLFVLTDGVLSAMTRSADHPLVGQAVPFARHEPVADDTTPIRPARISAPLANDVWLLPILQPPRWRGSADGYCAKRLYESTETPEADPWIALTTIGPDGVAVPLTLETIGELAGRRLSAGDAMTAAVDQLYRQMKHDRTVKISREDGVFIAEWMELGASLLLHAEFRKLLHQSLATDDLLVAIPTRSMLIATTQDNVAAFHAMVKRSATGPDGLTSAAFLLRDGVIEAMGTPY